MSLVRGRGIWVVLCVVLLHDLSSSLLLCTAINTQGYDWKYDAISSEDQYGGIAFADLPGFTRSVSGRDFALVTPESHVWAKNPLWTKGMTAHIISPALGANFVMYLGRIQSGGVVESPRQNSVERFVVVLDGSIHVTAKQGLGTNGVPLSRGSFMYMPCNVTHRISTETSSMKESKLLVFERHYRIKGVEPKFLHGEIETQPLIAAPGEVFKLRKLLPDTEDYDFNIHVMDFMPGEHLNVREVHYNQHGLLLMHGKGIYRLGNDWMPVKKGDAIWMAPFVPQWYGALGTEPSRYILYKDTTEDPLAVSDRM